MHPDWYQNPDKIRQLRMTQKWASVDMKGMQTSDDTNSDLIHPEFNKYIVGDEQELMERKEIDADFSHIENPVLRERKALKHSMTKDRLEKIINAKTNDISNFSEAEEKLFRALQIYL